VARWLWISLRVKHCNGDGFAKAHGTALQHAAFRQELDELQRQIDLLE
jgi:hypothetical protein